MDLQAVGAIGAGVVFVVIATLMIGRNRIIEEARALIKSEEGFSLRVYNDSLGNPTVGWGHLVLPQDNLRLGDYITLEKAKEFFRDDSKDAIDAAFEQVGLLNSFKPRIVVVLASVNYQLGTGWTSVFPQTWEALKNGDVDTAIKNLEDSLWNRQTPRRVAKFVSSIRENRLA